MSHISYALPEAKVSNSDLSDFFPEWSEEKIEQKTGIFARGVAGSNEYTSSLATRACRSLFEETGLNPREIDYLILCTQTPDFVVPGTSFLVHDSIDMRQDAGAIDLNLGCSGYVYGLSLAKGMIETGQVANVLLVTADTYTKLLNQQDRGMRTVFGDGATASLIVRGHLSPSLHSFKFGSDGSRASCLITPGGGLRPGEVFAPRAAPQARGLQGSSFDLYMDGPSIFGFTLEEVPKIVADILDDADLSIEEIDLFVFHQANRFMLEHLRAQLAIPEEKFVIELEDTGNTVSSTIPIALRRCIDKGRVRPNSKILVVGFGVGLSWAGAIMDWRA